MHWSRSTASREVLKKPCRSLVWGVLPAYALNRKLFPRARSDPYRRIECVHSGNRRLRDGVSLDGGDGLGAREVALHRETANIQRVQGEHVAMPEFVVPWRAR